jgi:RNA polymerase sigma-70 factor (sigma-E family)
MIGPEGRGGVVLTFDEFFDSRGDSLLRYATAITADPHTAKDVVQSVLERAFIRWDRISAMEHPDAYVRRMIVNEFISWRRRISRIRLTNQMPDLPPLVDHADQHADRDALIAQLRKLPNRQRAAVALRYWDDLTDAQIAAELGCSEGTVRSCIWHALRKLRAALPAASTTDREMERS